MDLALMGWVMGAAGGGNTMERFCDIVRYLFHVLSSESAPQSVRNWRYKIGEDNLWENNRIRG